MTLRIPAKVLIHVWSYDFYDMTLSTGKQPRHMINMDVESDLLDNLCPRLPCSCTIDEGWSGIENQIDKQRACILCQEYLEETLDPNIK